MSALVCRGVVEVHGQGTAGSCCGQGTVKKKVCRMALSHPSGTTLSQCSPSVRLWRGRGLVPISGEGEGRGNCHVLK